MADTKLILQVDNLDHKLISVDSEVAVNETFDIVFEGLSENEVGSTAKIELRTLSRKELVWKLEEVIQQLDDGALGISGCKIDTQNALDITRITSAKTILTLVLTDDYGNRTVYGSAQMRLHPGYGEGGEPLVEIERSVEKHNVDPEAHKELFKSLRDADANLRQEVDNKIVDSKNAEVEARNNAISTAINQAKDEMANSYKGDLTDFANSAAASARASASSANAAAIAADKTVEKLGEAYEVVEKLNGKISQVDGKVEVAGRYAESAEGAAGRANRSAERVVTAEENIGVYVTQVSGLAAGIKQDADRAAGVVGTVTEAKTAVETVKRQVEGLSEDVGGYKQSAVNAANAAGESAQRAEGAANTAKGHADRAEEAEGRANNYVNVELPNKVAILDKSIDDKMSAVDARLESAQTAILGNIDSKATEVSTALDGKIESASTAFDGKVTEAEQAKDDAVKAKDEAETANGQAEGFANDASTSASNASKSADASATSASQAQGYADEAKASVVDTLKRKIWAEGMLYSDNYNGSLAELKIDYKEIQRQFNFTANSQVSYTYFQLWGEHKKWVLCSMDYYHSVFAILDLDAKTVLHRFLNRKQLAMSYTAGGVCLTNTDLWQFTTTHELFRFNLASGDVASVTLDSLGIAVSDMSCAQCSAGLVPLANGDILFGAKYIIDKATMTVVGEVALEDGVTRNLKTQYAHIRDYAFLDKTDANSATPSPIYFLFMDGMPPLWIDDRWTTDADGKRVVTLRTIKTDDASIDLGVGHTFGIATSQGLSALVKGGSAVVRYMTIDTTQSAPNIVNVTKKQSYTFQRNLPYAFCLSKGYTPSPDADAKDAPHIVFKSKAMLAGYFGMKRGLGTVYSPTVYDEAFVLPSGNKFQESTRRGMHPGGSSEFFPLFGVTRNGTSVAIMGGQYGNAN